MWHHNLKSNQDKLVSNFDLHLTIKRFLNKSYQPHFPVNSHRSPIPLIEPIPTNRTCAEAGVPEHYCACIPETQLPMRSPLVQEAGRTLVDRLNHIIAPQRNLCEEHKLFKVLESRRLLAETQRIRLVVETTHG